MPGGRSIAGLAAVRSPFETFFAAFTSEHTVTVRAVQIAGVAPLPKVSARERPRRDS
jgi:hypothetical protein